MQRLEARYAKKKRVYKENLRDEVVKLKHQLAEALKVANLKSEEAIKLKAELQERTETENQRKLVQMSIASSDVLRQSLMSFKEAQDLKENLARTNQHGLSRKDTRNKDHPLGERVLNTESAPKNLIESHAKLYAKYVNSAHVGTKLADVCRVEVTLKPDEELPNCDSNATGKFKAVSNSPKESQTKECG